MPDSKPFQNPHEEWLLTKEEFADARIDQWLGLLRKAIYPAFSLLEVECAPCQEPLDLTSFKHASFRPVEPGAKWGETWDYAWLRFKGKIPAEWAGQTVAARINLGGECGIIGADGEFTQRLTHGSVFDQWCQVDEVPLSDKAEGGAGMELLVQAWASNLDGVSRPLDPDFKRPGYDGKHEGILHRAELCLVNSAVKALLHDAEILLGIARISPRNSVRRRRAYKALLDAVFAWGDDAAKTEAARAILAPELAKPASASALSVVATGHAHIDSAWMWRLKDSIGKCGRTFSHQIANIDRYPGYVFGASSPLHYEMVKEHYPKLYEKLRSKIAEDRWEIQSAMWVEPDTNVPSGESLIRQFLYGAAFIKDEFDLHCPIAWLPDVFGLSGCLPQIFKEAGVDYVVTKKPQWGRVNAFKKTAFRWRGNDGSEVLAHLLPQVRDYNGRLQSDDLDRAVQGFMESDRLESFLYTFGVGDGGGGPTELMLERAVRLGSIEGLPKVRFGKAIEVFEHFNAHRDALDAHHGEIYVEGHRGTYTSQGLLKKKNRSLEILLGQIEQLFSLLPVEAYPFAALKGCWKKVLTNQFHDILPGSGIREVIEDALEDYGICERETVHLLDTFARRLPEAGGKVSLFNGLAFPWRGSVAGDKALSGGAHQREPDGKVISLVEVDTLQFGVFEEAEGTVETTALSEPVLENRRIRCEFNANGQVVSLIEKASGREMIKPGAFGNQLSLYVDRPIDWDAWDVDDLYRQELIGTATAETSQAWSGWTGPARSVLEFNLRIGGSTILQRCILDNDGGRIDFQTHVDWSERHKMLRVGFATMIENGISRNSVQHGFIDRPVHRNTSFQAAHFETPCHRYACLLNGDGGLALLNDSKYGIRAEDNWLELALLRSTTFPDYNADQGEHVFTYSIMPFNQPFSESGVREEADRLNVRPLAFRGRDGKGLTHSFEIKGPGLSVDCVKRAETGIGTVVRLSNPTDRGVEAKIHFSDTDNQCFLADALENPRMQLEGESVRLKPFQFITLLIQ